MIRVNLLRPRTQLGGDLQSPLPRGRSAFVSGREILIALILLVAGASMLHLHYGLSEPEQAGAGEGDGADSPSSDLASPALGPRSQAAGSDAAGEVEEASPFTPATDGSSSSLVASPTPEQRAMVKARQEAAERAEPKSQPTTPPVPPPGTAMLRDMIITDRGGTLRLSLVTGERSTYTMFRLGDPNRVVVDIPGSWITLPSARLRQEISHPLVHRIRLGQYKADPPTSRLVLDVEGFPNLLIFPHSSGLDIQVSNTTE